MDGIGAVIKRTMWTAVKARKVILNEPIDCYNFLISSQLKHIDIFYVSKRQVEDCQTILENRWKHLNPIHKIQTKHYFEKSGPTTILAGCTAYSKLENCYLKEMQNVHCVKF